MRTTPLTLAILALARQLFEPGSGETFLQWLGSACFFEIAGERINATEQAIEDAINAAADLVIREEA